MINPPAVLGSLSLIGWLYLTFVHGQFWRILLPEPAVEPGVWPTIDIVIPARNEAETLPTCLATLLAQNYPGQFHIFLVDDNSIDGTSDIAQRVATTKEKTQFLSVIKAPELDPQWSGKVAAMQAGVTASKAEYILFTDADIHYSPDSLRQLVARAVENKLDLASLMVKLHCSSLAEKLFIPAFVFFFAMLYPFRYVNDEDNNFAAAAGGVMLTRREALNNIGGLAAIKGALIDDCSLAKAIKKCGGPEQSNGRIALHLSTDVRSLRIYPDAQTIERMVRRAAFTQLDYSPLLLTGTILAMTLLFIIPWILMLCGGFSAILFGLLAALLMLLIYLPMISFYQLPLTWTITLPLAALFYLVATIDSAKLYWQGKGGQWKGRTQA